MLNLSCFRTNSHGDSRANKKDGTGNDDKKESEHSFSVGNYYYDSLAKRVDPNSNIGRDELRGAIKENRLDVMRKQAILKNVENNSQLINFPIINEILNKDELINVLVKSYSGLSKLPFNKEGFPNNYEEASSWIRFLCNLAANFYLSSNNAYEIIQVSLLEWVNQTKDTSKINDLRRNIKLIHTWLVVNICAFPNMINAGILQQSSEKEQEVSIKKSHQKFRIMMLLLSVCHCFYTQNILEPYYYEKVNFQHEKWFNNLSVELIISSWRVSELGEKLNENNLKNYEEIIKLFSGSSDLSTSIEYGMPVSDLILEGDVYDYIRSLFKLDEKGLADKFLFLKYRTLEILVARKAGQNYDAILDNQEDIINLFSKAFTGIEEFKILLTILGWKSEAKL